MGLNVTRYLGHVIKSMVSSTDRQEAKKDDLNGVTL